VQVKTQIAVWGYALSGPNEVSAIHAEAPGEDFGTLSYAWDRTSGDLASQLVSHGEEPYRRVRDWAALPWAVEHVIRGHEDWPGL
jgi:hypothetical protein